MIIKPTMRSLLAKLTGPRRARVSIKPVCDYVFISGHGDEAQGGYLRGQLQLFVPDGQEVQSIQLKFTSRMWLGDHKAQAEGEVKWQDCKATIYQWDDFTIDNQVGLASKNGRRYEWPFELIAYMLETSTIHRDATEKSYSFAPIRIIRTPSFSSYELMDPTTVQGKWSDEAEYNLSIRHRAIALGGLIPIDAQLSQLSPTAKVTKARFYLLTLNTNGVTTEEDISMPIHLFISPELPVNGWGVFVANSDTTTKEVKDLLAGGMRVPPKYCKDEFEMEDVGIPLGTPPPAYSEVCQEGLVPA
ncbi:O-dinitrobenzene, calcium zinc resistance protein [Fusarium heterosporum]|uniref:O-dinitrobenzene, calcium zinc resistance protein n=1 Tax=Fusarium heterosporum TaxID=42747 RepID=A0A8H5U5A5_FUSHE|nr:O-dinitrobenzene, calcium zinc resistance protein [Fusarium heterosporum]